MAAQQVLRPLCAVLAVATAMLAALYLLAVCTTAGQRVEDLAIRGSDHLHVDPAWLQALLAALAQDSAIVVAVGLPLLLGWWRRRLATGVVVSVAVLAANVTTQVLKSFVFVRPDLGVDFGVGEDNSLPSGTVTLLLSTVLGVFALTPREWREHLAAAALPLWAVAVGGATVALDWHRPSDVLAAVLVVASWAVIARVVLQLMSLRTSRRRDLPITDHGPALRTQRAATQRATVRPSTTIVGLIPRIVISTLVFAAALGALAVLAGDGVPAPASSTMIYVVSQVTVAATEALVVLGILRMMTGTAEATPAAGSPTAVAEAGIGPVPVPVRSRGFTGVDGS